MMRACLTLAAGLLVGCPAFAGGVLVPTDQARIVVLGGELAEGDHQRFRSLISSVPADVVVLDGPYGRTDEAVLIAAEIRRADMNTFISGRDDCGPSCALIFLAGRTKYAGEGARISVSPTGFVRPAQDRQVSTGSVLQWLGVPETMRLQMASTAADELYWMREMDKAQLGIVTVTPGALDAVRHGKAARPNAPEAAKGGALRAPQIPRPRPLADPPSDTAAPPTALPATMQELPHVRYLAVPDLLPGAGAAVSLRWPDAADPRWDPRGAPDLVGAP